MVIGNVLKNIFENNVADFPKDFVSPKEELSQKDCFQLLPMILYCHKFKEDFKEDLNVKRVREFFKNLSRYQNINVDNKSVYYALDAINKMTSCDITSLVSCEGVSEHILTEEELIKLNILKDHTQRLDIEKEFWNTQSENEVQSHKIWNGKLSTLIDWSGGAENFDLGTFIKYRDLFDEIFGGKDGNIDFTRRALLTRELRDYPKCFRGQINKSFGLECNDWKVLIDENLDKFHDFFKEILNSNLLVIESLNKMCKNFQKESVWYDFVHIPELLSYCEEKNIQWGDKHGWVLVKKRNTRSGCANVNAYKLYIELCKLTEKFWDDRGWELRFHSNEDSCVVFENKVTKIAIDIKCEDKANIFGIEVFVRREGANTETELKDFAIQYGLSYNGSHYIKDSIPKGMVIEKIRSML